MLTQLALLPLAAVTVTGVTSEIHDGDVIVKVATSEPVPARVARPMVGNRLAYIFVDDATPEREVFENGEHPVVARARSRYTKLEVPLDPGVRCREPAAIETLPSGLRVQFPCGSNAGAAATVQGQGTRAPGRLSEARPPGRGASQELLKAALALPAEMPFADKTENEEDENPAAKPPAEEKPKQEREAIVLPAVKATVPAAKAAASAAAGPALAKTSEPLGHDATVAAAAPAKSAAASPTAASSAVAPAHSAAAPPVAARHPGLLLVMAMLALVAVAGGVLVLTRRRARGQGLIHILETAAIGPKRALLVARVNGQIMVLGASEAGIALLAPLEGASEPPVAAVMGSPPVLRGGPDELALNSAAEAAPEPDGEVSMLSRLFRLRPQQSSPRDADAFRELLDESYEDQELRDKLAQGLSGKVS
jgi:flagellar biogenesis protein FliO